MGGTKEPEVRKHTQRSKLTQVTLSLRDASGAQSIHGRRCKSKKSFTEHEL